MLNGMSARTLCLRYRNLPGGNLPERLAYVCHRLLTRFLVGRRVLDINGERTKPICGFSKWIPENERRQQQRLVCISGLGHSGSGALADLLSEYDGVDVRSFVDSNGSLKKASSQEFDILRYSGGLFSLENAFRTGNESHRDAAVKAFLHFVSSLYVHDGGVFNGEFLDRTRAFLDEILLGRSAPVHAHGYAYCPQMEPLGTFGSRLVWGDSGTGSVFWLKDMSVADYRRIAGSYVRDIIGSLSREPVLVLDQVISDGTGDMDKYEAYLGPIRLLAVYRDPRDVFATAVKLKANWIPSDPEVFVQWYKHRISPYHGLRHDHFRLIRFEDLVVNYAKTVAEVEEFLGIRPAAHARRKSCFDPALSVRNIGIHESIDDQAAVRKIRSELGDFCWAGG